MEGKSVVLQCLEIINDHLSDTQKPVLNYQDAKKLLETLNLDQKKPDDWASIFKWIKKYLAYTAQTDHPYFLNRMWSKANLPSILGEIIAGISNVSSCSYESAPASVLIEKYMIQKMLNLLGFEKGEGQMTTGSSQANMIAMMIARNLFSSHAKLKGLFQQKPLFAFTSEDAHYSMDKAANILGIGTHQLIKIPVNDQGQMNLTILSEKIEFILQKGGVPFFVTATSGTTVRGAYDSISDILKLREKYGFWLHVDAAWGGAVLVNDALRRQFLKDVEQANSFTWDFHKMLGSNLICNVLLVNLAGQKTKSLLTDTCSTGDTSYIYREGEKSDLDPGISSLQCARRVDGLKWFLDWKFYEKEGFSKRVEHYFQLCQYAESIVERTFELEMVAPRQSFNVCFRFLPPASIKVDVNEFNLSLRTKLYHDSQLLIAFAYIKNIFTFRLLMVNPDTQKKDLDELFKMIVQNGYQLLKKNE